MIRSSLVLLIVFPLAIAVRGQQKSESDFRTLGAPPEIHVSESRQLMALLQLNDSQQSELREIIARWKSDYLARKNQIDSLPPNDSLGRRGWPPSRDRSLNATIDELLNDEQYQRFNEILALWNFGPVRSANAFRYDWQGELKIGSEQHRQLHDLNVQWVLFALPRLQGKFPFARNSSDQDRGLNFRQSMDRLQQIATDAWKFKPERDQEWVGILSAEQARRWRQLELQRQFHSEGFRVLTKSYAERDALHLPNTGVMDDYRVPYFDFPARSLRWTPQQQTQLAKRISEFENQQGTRPQNRQEFIQWSRDQGELQRRYLRKIEAMMTEKQKKQWRQAVGDPYGPRMRQVLR